jgi:hypothetical protein
VTEPHGLLDVTVAKVCPVDCAPLCPQRPFQAVYGTLAAPASRLSLDNFRIAISTVPERVTIGFGAFSEPCVHPQLPEMMEMAHEQGHRVNLCTTLFGLTPAGIERIRDIHPESLVVHTPDNEDIAHLPGTAVYKEVLYLAMKRLAITGFSRMSADYGFVSNERAGNCDGAPPRRVWGPFHCSRLTPSGFVMLPNGDVVLCCMDWRLRHRIGNLLTGTYDDLLRSPEYRRVVRDSYGLGIGQKTLCRSCMWPLSIGSLLKPDRQARSTIGIYAHEVKDRVLRG